MNFVQSVFGSCSCAIVTPFTDDDSLDAAALQKLIAHVARGLGANGSVIVAGSTGEQHSMTVEERAELYQTAVDVAQGHTIVAGVAAVRTRDAVLLAKAAKKAGVAGIMLGLPPYVKPTETEVEQYCNAVLEHVKDVPVLLYNNTGRNGSGLSVAGVVRLFNQWDNVVGVKIVGDTHALKELATELHRAAPTIKCYTGSDVSFFELRAQGETVVDGLTSVMANVYPRQISQCVEMAIGAGDQTACTSGVALTNKLSALLRDVSTPTGIKLALSRINLACGVPRRPLGTISDEKKAEIEKIIVEMNGN